MPLVFTIRTIFVFPSIKLRSVVLLEVGYNSTRGASTILKPIWLGQCGEYKSFRDSILQFRCASEMRKWFESISGMAQVYVFAI